MSGKRTPAGHSESYASRPPEMLSDVEYFEKVGFMLGLLNVMFNKLEMNEDKKGNHRKVLNYLQTETTLRLREAELK